MNVLIIFFAQYAVLLSVLAGIVTWRTLRGSKRRAMSILVLVSFPFAYLLGKLAGLFFSNPRPFISEHVVPLISHEATNGFPSDHTLFTMAIASAVFPFNKKLGMTLGILSVVIGISRVLAGVHHAVDIAGGSAMAIIASWATWVALRRLNIIGTAADKTAGE